MALVEQSLAAATATGPGTVVEFDTPKVHLSMAVSVTGSPSSFQVNLEGSVDGVNFSFQGAVTASGNYTFTSSGPFTAARANLISLSGGTSPTVTATIAAA